MLDWENDILKIDGLLTEHEGVFLYEQAKEMSLENAIVEIGSWKGRATVCLAKGAKEGKGAKVFAIDPHTGSSEHKSIFGGIDTFQEFLENIKKADVKEFVVPTRDASESAAKDFNQPVGFVFIDGAHERRLVELDFQLWFPKVVDGGLIAFHDSWFIWGPLMVSAKVLLTSSKVKTPKLVDSITCFEKTEQNTIVDRIRNTLFVICRPFSGIIQLLQYGRKIVNYLPSPEYLREYLKKPFK